MDYKNGKIYRIVCDITGENYYGSTTQPLYKRLSRHKSKGNVCTSNQIIKRGNYSIVLVEEYPCDNKQQLNSRERYYIENNICINKVIPGQTRNEWIEKNEEYIAEYKKQYYENNKEYYKQYQLENKEKCDENKKKYYETKKVKIQEQQKQHYENNKDDRKKNMKIYYENNKEQIAQKHKEKITCECGSIVSHNHIARHRKSKKHIDIMNS